MTGREAASLRAKIRGFGDPLAALFTVNAACGFGPHGAYLF
jgi:hypothetical protein